MPEPPTIRADRPKALLVSSQIPAASGRKQNILVLVVAAVAIAALAFAGAIVFMRQGRSPELSSPAAPVATTAPLLQSDSKPVPPENHAAIVFSATNARLHGTKLQLESRGLPDIGYWDDSSEWISWEGLVPKSGKYKVSVCLATFGGEFVVGVGGATVLASGLKTGGWENFSTNDIGIVEIGRAGEITVSVRAKYAESWNTINLNSVQLTPADFNQ